MFNMRIKINPPRNTELRCFFCLHVRTATILLGIWQLMLHIVALSILALCMRNQHMLAQRPTGNDIEPGNLLPTPLSKTKDDNLPYYLPTTQDGRHIYQSDMDMGALMTVCTLAITLLMVYGTVKGKATHILPFFCLQLFDFAIATLTATGYFCYIRSVHSFVNEHWHNLPYKNELLDISPQYLSLIVLAVFVSAILWKGYCISVVWRCYKYLTLRQQAARSTVHYILRGDDGERIPDPEYLLPDYEAACASFKQPPPPSYQAAMEQPPPPAYPDSINPRVHYIVAETAVENEITTPEPIENRSNDIPTEGNNEQASSVEQEEAVKKDEGDDGEKGEKKGENKDEPPKESRE